MNDPTATTITQLEHPLKTLRKARGLSQFAAAIKIKCAPNIIVHTEIHNYRPTMDIQLRIATFFGVTPKDIWRDDEESSPMHHSDLC